MDLKAIILFRALEKYGRDADIYNLDLWYDFEKDHPDTL